VIPSNIDPVLVIQAANVAAQWHAAQRRKGARKEPYVNHLLEVAELVADALSRELRDRFRCSVKANRSHQGRVGCLTGTV
jgi:hypothetical protein